MTFTLTTTASENLHTKYQFNTQTADNGGAKVVENVDETGTASTREPDFAELHATYEIEYEQFLADIDVEITKRTQRLSKLESIVYGISLSE